MIPKVQVSFANNRFNKALQQETVMTYNIPCDHKPKFSTNYRGFFIGVITTILLLFTYLTVSLESLSLFTQSLIDAYNTLRNLYLKLFIYFLIFSDLFSQQFGGNRDLPVATE